jgi:hypothetical protein
MRRATVHLGHRAATGLALAVVCAVGAACASAPDRATSSRVSAGELGEARRLAFERTTKGKADERALDLMRLVFVTMADGYPASAEVPANELFDLLRRQGLNADRTLAATVINEDLKRWKGEPFEQAMAYAQIAAQKLARGDWGNARAAASGSLFLLKSFGDASLTREELAQRAADRAAKGEGDYLDNGYQPVETDFALGYALHGIASLAMGREEEASDNLRRAADIVPAWGPAVERMLARDFDTVLIVEFGDGPERVLTGMDGAIAEWAQRTASGPEALAVRIGDGETERFAWVEDTNRMARDHRWGGLSDVRAAKSVLGQGLMAAGTGFAIASDEDELRYMGLGLILAGLVARAGAHADPRFCEVLPQRVYIVPVTVGSAGGPAMVQVDGAPGSRLDIAWVPGVERTPDAPFAVRVVRVMDRADAPAWATAGVVRYAHDGYPGRVPGDELPWILGGMCVRIPSHETLRRYQDAGNLVGMTTAQLAELYRLEGISWDLEALGGIARGHILEGGTTLIPPDPGTAGAARLFSGDHGAYTPRSREVRELADRIRMQRSGAAAPVEIGAR